MTTEYTPGPWRVDDVGVGFEIAAGNEVVAQAQQVYGDHKHKIRRGNARRIVACVNACEGISTEQLESWLCMSRPIRKSLEELKAEADREGKQRDDLIAVLQRIADGQEMSGTYTFADVVLRYQEIARAAIAKATGEQP